VTTGVQTSGLAVRACCDLMQPAADTRHLLDSCCSWHLHPLWHSAPFCQLAP